MRAILRVLSQERDFRKRIGRDYLAKRLQLTPGRVRSVLDSMKAIGVLDASGAIVEDVARRKGLL